MEAEFVSWARNGPIRERPQMSAKVGKPSNGTGRRISAYGYKRRFNVVRLMSAWARIADAIGRKADVTWEFAERAEIYAACAASLRRTC